MGGKLILFYILFVSQSKSNQLVNAINSSLKDEKGSLVFVFDTTGSMFNDLKQLREGAEMILKTALEESNIIADFVFVPFHDPAVGPATVTTHKEVFKSALNIVRVYGGGDCPEKSLGGIQLALNVSRPRSFVFVFTDATASDHRLVNKVLDNVQRKQSQVVFVLTGHCNDVDKPPYKVYQQIAAASSGQVFNLNKTSVYKVLEFVRSSIKGRTVNLGSTVNPAGYNYTQKIPVDKTVNEVTVSVSGSEPQIRLVSPTGEEITGPPQLVTILDLSEIMIVSVLSPAAGVWGVRAGSTAPHSVRVRARSELDFTHGFSVARVTDLKETSYRPLKGTYNNMLISLSANESVKLDHAELLDLNGKLLFEVPLKDVDATHNVYIAEAFIPPEDFFNIAVVGVDSSGQTVRRAGRTAVSATVPDVPYLVVSKKIVASAHSRVVLRCAVESLVPVRATWTRRGRDLHAHTHSLQSTTVEHVIEDMTEGEVGTYRCIASNAAGNATADTGLDMIVSPPQVSLAATGAVTEGDRVVLRCSVYSDAYVQRARIEFEGKSRRNATNFHSEPTIDGFYNFNITIESASEADSGVYTCFAVNRGGVSNQSTNIIVLLKPTALILGPHTLTKLIHSDIQLVCHVDNAKQILWIYNDYIVERNDINGSYNAMLNVDNVKEDGTWTCKAITGSYNASDSVHLTIQIKPQVTIIGSKNISLPLNSTYNVTCTVVARPQPRVLWHRETEEFLYHVLTNPEPNVYTSVLIVNGTGATYFCFGENTVGIDQDSVVVNIYTPMVIAEGLKDTSVELYSPLKFHCNISASPQPTIKWYHNNTRIQTNKNKENETSVLIEDNVLIFNRVIFDNLGDYSCEADNGYEKMILNCSLTVHGLANPMIYKEPVKIVVHKGNSLNLTCRILSGNPKPNITWQYVQNSNLTILPVEMVKEGSVVIHKVDKENAGRYRCEASNEIGRDLYEVTVIVQYKPEHNLNQEAYKKEGPIQAKSGETIRLHCNFTGDPLPIVTWAKNGSPVTYTKNLYLSNESLVIENVTKFDSGVFTCNASNILGAILKNFTINVYASPIISNSSNTELQVLEGQLVELPCLASGIPEPEIRWTHNGQDINDVRRHRDEYGLRFVANLTDFGEYECIASNAFGNSSFNYTLYIWVPPSIDSPLEEIINIKKGSNISFECDAVGFPIPAITWEYNDVILIENTTSVSFSNVGYLSITNASVSVAGVYSCVADNIAGTAVKNYIVLVNEPPHLLRDDYSGVYVASTLDRELAISCRAAGDPPPYVYWSRDGVSLHSDARYDIDPDGTLSIKNPTEQATGVYSCTARNTAGSDSKDVHVQIYSPPSLLQEAGAPLITSVVEGSDVRVNCPVRGNVTVKWYKDAILLSNGTLNFFNISRKSASTYACVASNAIGSVHINVIIDVKWPPKLQDGGEVEILAGNDYYFNCTTDAKPQAEIKWLFNSKALIGENKEKLSILDAKAYNSGIYRCFASNPHGTVFKDTQLHVLEPPILSDFDNLEVELKAGANATLDCTASGSPRPHITWSYNNTDWVLQDTSLVSYNVTSLSEGVFICRASNRAGSKSLVYRVVVVAVALVEDVVIFVEGEGRGVEGSVEITLGTNARVACKASGKPEPIIQWLHNGNTVSNNTGLYADLTFKNATISNKGLYICIASNIGGVDQRRIKVDVLEPPRIFQSLFHNANSSQNTVTLEVLSDQVFYLHCHPYGNPIPDIYWFKDGVPLKFYDDEMVSTDYGEIIFSKSAKYEQSGNYTCVAKNKVDNTSVSYLVDVLVPPPPLKGDIKQVSIISGTPLNITCPVDGHPPPVVAWIKHPYTDLVDTSRIHLLNYNYTLFFTITETSDSGKYSCVITNSVGTTELVYDIMILTPPAIAGNDSQLIVALGRSIVLKCIVDGIPEPKVTWFKDIQPLAPSSASVHQAWHTHVTHVLSARLSHAGEYRCVAENTAGVVQRRYSVTVQVPGKWSSWSSWGYCNVTCGLGYQQRQRQCQYIDDDNNVIDKDNEPANILIDESSCKGSAVNRRKCHMPSCEERPMVAWSSWSAWSACSSSCGAGSQLRARVCPPGGHCTGDDLQIRKCTGLPKCEYDRKQTIVSEDVNKNINPDYIPEAIFEIRPEATVLAKPTPPRNDDYNLAESPRLYEVKVTENLDHSEQGPCNPGYRHIAKTNSCEDIDECVSPLACHQTQTCFNTERGYACSCARGYSSLGAGQRCLDVNECTQGLHGCEFACVNTAGGYVCACPPPLRLHTDKRHCVAPLMHHEPEQYDEDYEGTIML